MNRGARVRERVRARRNRRPYQTVAIGLYEDQARAIDRAIQELQQAGYTKANRSLLFQTLAKRFLEEIAGLDQGQILDYVLRAHLRRPLARAAGRQAVSLPKTEITEPITATGRSRRRAQPV